MASSAVTPERRNSRAGVVAIACTAIAAALLGTVACNKLAGSDRPSLVASGRLAVGDRVVVADFANLTADSLLAASITEAFRVGLGRSPLIRVLTTGQVASALQQMGHASHTALGAKLAREVATHEDAKAIVAGTVAKFGVTYAISVRLLGTERGNALATFEETADDSSGLLNAVDRASKLLRSRIGESLGTPDTMP
jgi:hypothetical protein